MSNIVDCLDQLGRTSALRHATGAELEIFLKASGLTAQERVAILNRNQQQLHEIAGAQANTCCMIHTPDDEEEEDDEQEDKPEQAIAAPHRTIFVVKENVAS